MVPVLSHIRCHSSKRVVQAHQPVATVRTLFASCPAADPCCPDMWLPRWALVALPDSILLCCVTSMSPKCKFLSTCHRSCEVPTLQLGVASVNQKSHMPMSGCPKCSQAARVAEPQPTFAEARLPELVAWDFERNDTEGIYPNKVILGSNKMVHWVYSRCPRGQPHR